MNIIAIAMSGISDQAFLNLLALKGNIYVALYLFFLIFPANNPSPACYCTFQAQNRRYRT